MNDKPEIEFENDRLLDKLLKEEPDYFLPDDFADDLARKITIQQSVKQDTLEFLTILGAVAGILICFGGIFYFLNKEDFMALKALAFTGYTPGIALIALFVFFMDRVLLRLLNQLKM